MSLLVAIPALVARFGKEKPLLQENGEVFWEEGN